MKNFILLVFSALCFFGSNAQSLPYMSHGPLNSKGEFIFPLDYYQITFYPQLQLLDGYNAQILLENEIIVESSNFEIQNYESGTVEQCDLTIWFDGRLLPKGHTYTLRLNAGSIADAKNPEIVNENLYFTLAVPANLNHYFGLFEPYIKTSDENAKICTGCEGWIADEVDPIGSPVVYLQRNGETIGEYPADIQMQDWDLSSMFVYFPAVTLDEGAEYTLVLPANSCCSQYREDLTNDELTFVIQEGSSAITEVELTDSDRNQPIYDLTGRRVLNPAKGLYIINGRKTLLR